jgi:UDP-N-acetylglucosamine--N-acetylmuramyl-(pentapeptide) pyrophosphoryl-undecaprenol N-acetylglucosamine transferase
VYPAVTVLDALKLDKSTVLWVGSHDGMEEALITRLEIPFMSIPAAGIHGVGIRSLPGNFWKLLKGFISSRKILKSFKPDVLFFTGGYVAFPMAVAALRKPSILYVPDIEPGLALKALARFADQIALTTQSSTTYFPDQSKLKVTGYPIRPDLNKWSRVEALDYFGFSSELPTLAVVGGSKGARSINNALMSILPSLLDEMQVIHLTGHLDWETVDNNSKKLSSEHLKRYQVFPYLHEIGAVFAAANLIVSRAGASTLGEYPAFGLPAILVPYPYAWRYQKVNANYLVKNGAALLLEDEKLENELYRCINNLMSDKERLYQMSQAMASLAEPEAAKKIAALIRQITGRPDGGIAA